MSHSILFLQARFGMNAEEAGRVYGTFLFGIYFIPLLGGIIADKLLGFGKTITLGIILMIAGYLLLSQPGSGKFMIYISLTIISFGTGFFKGNLQALVGKLYDDSKLDKFRDAAFWIFYMGINVGAFFAPSASMTLYGISLRIADKTLRAFGSSSTIRTVAMLFFFTLLDRQEYRKCGTLVSCAFPKQLSVMGFYNFSGKKNAKPFVISFQIT